VEWHTIQVGSHIGDTYNNKIFHKLSPKDKVILIEPVKALFDELVINCNHRYPKNNFVLLNCAISDKNGTLKLYIPDIEVFSQDTEPTYISKGLPNWVDQLSSVHKNHIKDHHLNVGSKGVEVECYTLNHIVEKYKIKELKQLYIDTEGCDYEVLNGLDFNKLKPLKIVFEHKHMEGTNKTTGERYNQLMDKLSSHGYHVAEKDDEDTTVLLQM
jgi:FkbM family methyltransferase